MLLLFFPGFLSVDGDDAVARINRFELILLCSLQASVLRGGRVEDSQLRNVANTAQRQRQREMEATVFPRDFYHVLDVTSCWLNHFNNRIREISISQNLMETPIMVTFCKHFVFIANCYLFKIIFVSDWLTFNCEIVKCTQLRTKYRFFTFLTAK